MRMRRLTWLAAAPVLLLTGCASTAARPDGKLDSLVRERTGSGLEAPSDDSAARLAALEAIKGGLSEDKAVRLALVNNRAILASLEEVGVARAELLQARILSNPEFEGGLGYYGDKTLPHYTLTQDVLELVLYPLRRKAGAERFEEARLRVGHSVLSVVTEARGAFYSFLAAEQALGAARDESTAAGALAELARRQAKAGNLNELNEASLEAMEQEAELELARRQAEATVARAELAEALGLETAAEDIKAGETLAEPPGAEPPSADLEAQALSRRLDLAAARRKVAALEKSLSLARWQLVPGVRLGVEREAEPENSRVSPELQLEIPLFDRGQARRAGARAQLRQARQELALLEVRARKEVRAARARAAAARAAARVYRSRLLPLKSKIVAQTQLHYNYMLLGVDHLLEAKREQVQAARARVEALKDYWTERARLELAAGGKFETVAEAAEPPAPAPDEPTPPSEKEKHKQHGDHQ